MVEEGTGVGVEEVHIGRAQSEGNFDNDEAEEGEEDSGSGGEDLGDGAEEDMGDLEDFSNSRSSRDFKDDNIIEGAMALGGRDQAMSSLEADVADTGTSPSRGRPPLKSTNLSHIVRCSLMHGAPPIGMEKRRKLVHARNSGDAGGPNMLDGPASPPPHPSTSVDTTTMAMVMPIAIRRSPFTTTLSL